MPPSGPNAESQETKHNIKVARFEVCRCEDARYDDGHLRIEVVSDDLAREKAVAMSYAIGAFERQKVALGHFGDQVDTPFSILLGAEWDVRVVRNRLAELTTEYNGVWIDQISIDQQNISQELGRIPAIYAGLDVVAMLPGCLCTCLQEAVGQYEAGGGPRNGNEFNLFTICEKCLNSIGFCDHYNRLWTNQEFRYARSIRIIRSSPRNLRCVLPQKSDGEYYVDRDAEADLNPFARLLFLRTCLKADTGNDMNRIRQRSSWLTFRFSWAFLEWLQPHFILESTIRQMAWENGVNFQIAKFLLGEPFRRTELNRSEAFVTGSALMGMHAFKLSDLLASEARDYVLAIWPEMPGYVVPERVQSHALPDLLDNAIRQFERLRKITLPVTAPSGLFDDSLPSGVWKPSKVC